jgi:hypothetical protein
MKALLVGGMAAAALALVPALAVASPAQAKPLYSRGFHIFNNISPNATMQLVSVTGDGHFEGAPTPVKNTPFQTFDDFELQIHAGGEDDSANYQVNLDNGAIPAIVHAEMSIDGVGGSKNVNCQVFNYDPNSTYACSADTNADPVFIQVYKQK